MKSKIISASIILCVAVTFLSLLTGWLPRPKEVDPNVIKASAAKSLSLLQQSDNIFTNNAKIKCASCHHNTLTAMATEIAHQKGVPVIDSLEKKNVKSMEFTLLLACNPNKVNEFLPANFVIPYILMGLSAEKFPANMTTDIAVDYMMSQARGDGSFLTESGRVPMETGDVHLAAFAIRSIQLYASPAKKSKVDELVSKTRKWLENIKTDGQQELAFQLMGLQWCGSDAAHKTAVAQKLTAIQNKDGGWSQLPTLGSDAYATGQALYALFESGMAKPGDPVYQKGLSYLLKTQNEKGAWVVETRSFPIQPFVDSNFPPYNHNQFISAAATNWAVMALMRALPDASDNAK